MWKITIHLTNDITITTHSNSEEKEILINDIAQGIFTGKALLLSNDVLINPRHILFVESVEKEEV